MKKQKKLEGKEFHDDWVLLSVTSMLLISSLPVFVFFLVLFTVCFAFLGRLKFKVACLLRS